jgi:hypothetical protein
LSEVSTRGGGPDGRSTAEIEADIVRTRRQLAATLDELAVRVHPSTIAADAKAQARAAVDRTVGRAYAAANGAVERVSSQFKDEKGEPRKDRIALAAGAAAAVVVGIAVLSARGGDGGSGRSKKSRKRR